MDNWQNLAEEITSLHQKMDFNVQSTGVPSMEESITNWIAVQKGNPMNNDNQDNFDDGDDEAVLKGLLSLVTTFKKHESFLSQLFGTDHRWDGVDVLTEYCEYYASVIRQYKLKRPMDTGDWTEDDPMRAIGALIGLLSKPNATDQHINAIWEKLCLDASYRKSYKAAVGDGNCFPVHVAMVIMSESDLDAAINDLITTAKSCFKVTRLLVQESVKERFMKLFNERQHVQDDIPAESILPEMFVYRNKEEAIKELNSQKKLIAVSVWSENVTAAKNLASAIEVRTAWINTHAQLAAGLNQPIELFLEGQISSQKFTNLTESTRPSNLTKDYSKRIDLFYKGSWQKPVEGKYWLDEQRVAHGQASRRDVEHCVTTAHEGFKVWRSVPLNQRVNILRRLADRLRADGKSHFADTVSKWTNAPSFFGSALSITKDGGAEILTTRHPVGVVAIARKDIDEVFAQLVCALVAGNSVIVVSGQDFISLTQYCEMFITSGFPVGTINFLSSDHPKYTLATFHDLKLVFTVSTDGGNEGQPLGKNWSIRCYKGDPYYDEMLYKNFSKPKSIWVTCN